VTELYYFSELRWRRAFEANGFEVTHIGTNRLFYTGYGLLPSLSLRTRRRMASVLGAGCSIFVTRVRPD
jgi:hypothetical protein